MKKTLIIMIALFFFLGVTGFSYGAEKTWQNPYQEKIDLLNEEIQANGLRWRASITSITRLEPGEKFRLLGGQEPVISDETGKKFEYIPQVIPPIIDWRDNNGKNAITPVKNQQDCGSCFIFGTLATVEAMFKIEKGRYDRNPDFSEQHVLACSNAGDCAGGGQSGKVLDFLRNTGVAPEHCYPYQAIDTACNPCSNWKNRKANIQNWQYLCYNNENRQAIYNAIQKGPLVGFFEVYSDFYDYANGIYEKTPSATYEGGHIISIIGYNKNQGYWICKNSWGTGWGEDGYFKIAFGECRIGTWVQSVSGVTVKDEMPLFQSIGNKTVNEGDLLSFNVKATDPDKDPLEYGCSLLPDGATFDPGSGQFSWTPQFTQAGTYKITFTACDTILKASRRITITVKDIPRKIGYGKF